MSDSTPPRPPAQRDGCLMFVMVLVGVILLLPGLCALAFVVSDPRGMLTDWLGVSLVGICTAITAGGVALIWVALRPRR